MNLRKDEKTTIENTVDIVVHRLFKWCVMILILLLTFRFLFDYFEVGFDSTDMDGKRSGLAIMTDAKTGCEYLSTSSGGLTPRLNSNGSASCLNLQQKEQ